MRGEREWLIHNNDGIEVPSSTLLSVIVANKEQARRQRLKIPGEVTYNTCSRIA